VVLGGFGMGLGYPATSLVALEGVAPNLQGAASGIQNTSLQAGGAMGTAIAATILGTFGTQFATLGLGEQVMARTVAASVLAALALLGALALLAFRAPSRLASVCPADSPTP
jgi:MFS family permease